MEEQNCKTATRYKKLEVSANTSSTDDVSLPGLLQAFCFEFVAMTQTVLAAWGVGDRIVEAEDVALAGDPMAQLQAEPLGEFCAIGEGVVQGREPDCWHP
jgi:5-formaminoimidazole-4-carboxamide-1-beta-D-ribofuranosyl 5'-monophosphate synthetase